MNMDLWIVTPFEMPDVGLVSAVRKAFPVLHLGRVREKAEDALRELSNFTGSFGVCVVKDTPDIPILPDNVTKIIMPVGMCVPSHIKAEVVRQVCSREEFDAALSEQPTAVILKGAEGAGACGENSSFLLFRQCLEDCQKAGVALFIQGGAGVHTTAAYVALGASGVVMDSQIVLLPECGAPAELKTALSRLNGSEIRVSDGFRYYKRPEAPDILENRIAVGQDVILASDFAERFKTLKEFLAAVRRAVRSHGRLARTRDGLARHGGMAQDLRTEFPLTQGPMARVSDVPEFLSNVADGGALPFLAMGLAVGQTAEHILQETAAVMCDRPWGVGILGFSHPDLVKEQTRLILQTKPTAVLIAGGRPAQAKPFEEAGMKVFLHVPAPALLDLFMKEGAHDFVFEGRESGGHVGPLFSAVLWEKQMGRILEREENAGVSVLFAGGVFDAFTAAFVRIMAAPLVARDTHIGLQIGTAYLYTDEIVKSGAILPDYRDLLITSNETVLLKSGNGQETRAVPSPFTGFFLSEKERLEKSGLTPGEVLTELEYLNLGRSRIAGKGVIRRDGTLVPVSQHERQNDGLYMTGAVTALINNTSSIQALHESLLSGSKSLVDNLPVYTNYNEEKISETPRPRTEDIAIVGMAGIFPDAADVDEYWRNILSGVDSVREVPPERWSPDLFYNPQTKDTDHVVSKWGGFIGASDFNALEFGITPSSLASIEPVQLLSLLVAKRALQDAGYSDLSKVDLDDTSVIFGAQGAGELAASYGSRSGFMKMFGDLPEEAGDVLPRLTEDSFPGVLSNVISGRISNRLNTGGRNYTVDAACASSLAALDIAVSELTSGKSNMVVLGGSDLHNGIYDFLMFSSTQALSRKGRCSAFDADADGIVLGEGVGVVILKRLQDAERDGNRIYALLKGVGGASDGKSLGLTAPGKHGQRKALERAYINAGVTPSDIGLIEAHGTGTAVGDRIELSALTDVFLDDAVTPARTQIGSVKTQIGHTKCAAGVAGLIKAVLCVRHGIRPATLHLSKPNDAYTPGSPFFFRTEKPGIWSEKRRVAGVSGFGFGGANFHAIVENYEQEIPPVALKAWPAELFVFHANTPADAKKLMEQTLALIDSNQALRLRDVAYTLAGHEKNLPIQYAVVAGCTDDLTARLENAIAQKSNEFVYPLHHVEGKVAFLFAGQGSQRLHMAADLFVMFPKLRERLEKHSEYEHLLFPPSVFTDEAKKARQAAITETANAQPMLGLVDMAVAELLKEFGILPDMLCGHSYGEIPALCFAGALEERRLMEISQARANAITSAAGEKTGNMAAVLTDTGTITRLLEHESNVWAVNYNSPEQTVIAGSNAGLDAFLKKLDETQISYSLLNVSGPFHSPLLVGADSSFAEFLRDVDCRSPEIPVWSNTTAQVYPNEPEAIRARLAEHLVRPVRFSEEIEQMYDAGARVFIEAGPGGTLTGLAAAILRGREFAVIQTERGGEEGLTYFLRALAKYISTGRTIDMDRLFDGRDAAAVDLDNNKTSQKNSIIWKIDGQKALPANGQLPAGAGKLMTEPIRFAFNRQNDTESIMMAYLDNIKAVIQDQRDVMLGYLGSDDISPGTSRQPRAPRQVSVPEDQIGKEAELAPVALISEDGALPDSGSMSSEQIGRVIFEVVSEKTGYPMEMLGMDMDLEADLSIDSIKKMEIIGALRQRIALPEADMDSSFEQMISIKTFRSLVDWIKDMGKTESASAPGSGGFAGTALADTVEPEVKTGIVRMTLTQTQRPIGQINNDILRDKIFAITESEHAAALVEELIVRGAKARVIADGADISDCDGLIFIHSAAENRHGAVELFAQLKSADMNKLEWLCAVENRENATPAVNLPAGFPGFVKTLGAEFSGKRFCAITFESPISAAAIADELAASDPLPEVTYRENGRFLLLPQIEKPEPADDTCAGLEGLDADSVILVTGGAQGITPHLIAKLAERLPCRYVLVGRTSAKACEQYENLETVDEIRRFLIEHEDMKTPKEVEEKARLIHKQNQIVSAVKRVETAGGKAEYRDADVQDENAFRGLIAELKNQYGHIDGVIHAAGILEDKFFKSKTVESFRRVYDTKTKPLSTILQELPECKLLVLFSSMTSAFGNAGQIDYAAGNSALDCTARALGQNKRVVAFNWGPWKGAGMVNAGLEKEFRKKGVAFLNLEEGAAFFANETAYGSREQILAIGGEEAEVARFIETATQRTGLDDD